MGLLPVEQLIQEGLAKIVVPRLELYKRPDGKIEPAWMPVFYNPEATMSRDFTVLFLKTIMGNRDFFFIDTLAGTGVRGVRIGLEVGGSGILNDIDPRAYYYVLKNISLNNLSTRLTGFNHEANALLNSLVLSGVLVDYVDIDPYGSPVPYIDSALKPIGKRAYMGVTATDTAVLACTYPHKTLARYWSKCTKIDFDKEFAARLLISSIVLRAAALEIETRPLLVLVYKYYVRVFVETRRSARNAHRIVRDCIKYLWYCPGTLERGFIDNPEDLDFTCHDGSKPIILGRIWSCELYNQELVNKMNRAIQEMSWITSETAKTLQLILEEAPIETPYYRLDKLCSRIGVNMPSVTRVVTRLRELGKNASRTHIEPRSIRTNASYIELVEVIRELGEE